MINFSAFDAGARRIVHKHPVIGLKARGGEAVSHGFRAFGAACAVKHGFRREMLDDVIDVRVRRAHDDVNRFNPRDRSKRAHCEEKHRLARYAHVLLRHIEAHPRADAGRTDKRGDSHALGRMVFFQLHQALSSRRKAIKTPTPTSLYGRAEITKLALESGAQKSRFCHAAHSVCMIELVFQFSCAD